MREWDINKDERVEKGIIFLRDIIYNNAFIAGNYRILVIHSL